MRSIRESKKVSAVSAQQMRRQHKPQRIPLIPDIRWYSPSNVKALAQSAISFSLTRRSNDAEKYPGGTGLGGVGGEDGPSLSTPMVVEPVVAVVRKQRKRPRRGQKWAAHWLTPPAAADTCLTSGRDGEATSRQHVTTEAVGHPNP
jgi:hypothetical protein